MIENSIDFIKNERTWKVRATFENGLVLDETTLMNFTITSSQDTSRIIGATLSEQLDLQLKATSSENLNGYFALELGLVENNDVHYISMGNKWKVEEVIQENKQICKIKAFDRMAYFGLEKYVEGTSSDEIYLTDLKAHIEQKFGITIEGEVLGIKIINPYNETYKTLISYLAMSVGANACFKRDADIIRIVPLKPSATPNVVYTPSTYYNCKYDRAEFSVKQINLNINSTFGYKRGQGSTNDEIITLNFPYGNQLICDNIYNKIYGYTQEGIQAKLISNPALEMFDTIQLTDVEGKTHKFIAQGMKVTFNGGLSTEINTTIMKASNTIVNSVENRLLAKIEVESNRILSIVEADYQKKQATLSPRASRENIQIVLDEDMTPSKTQSIPVEFKVFKNSTTEELACVIKSCTASDSNITLEYNNTSNILTINVDTNRVFTNEFGYIDVVLETIEGDIRKSIYWNTVVNTVENSILNLSATTTIFHRENAQDSFSPAYININAQCSRCELANWLYSTNGGSTFTKAVSGSNGLTISGSTLRIVNNSNLFLTTDNVVIKAEANDGTNDTITITRVQDINSIYIFIDNEAHIFEADSEGNAIETEIEVNISAYKGAELQSCTIGTITGIPNGMSITKSGSGTTTPKLTISVDNSMTTTNGSIIIPVTCDGITFRKKFSYSLAIAGADGEDSKLIKITASTNVFKSTDGTTYEPSTINLSYIVQGVIFSKWQYSIDGGKIWADITNDSNGFTISEDALIIENTCDLYTDNITSISFKAIATNTENTEEISDVITIPRLKDGDNAVNVILGNEAHSFDANYEGYAIAGSTTTSVLGYVGATQKAVTIGTISGLPTGMTAKINNNSTTSASVTFTVATTMTSRNGVVTIPCTCNGVTINKIFSYSLALDGSPASSCKITTNTTTFLSTDGGSTYSPTTITLTPTFTLCSFSKWQYLNNGTWTDIASGSNGFTIDSNKKLSVAISTPLFNNAENNVLNIKLVTNKTNVVDSISLYKLSQIDGISTELENMKSEIEQTNNAWKATFSTSSANNLIFDGDFNRAFEEIYWANASGTTLSYKTVKAYPFYEDRQTLCVEFPNSSSSTVGRVQYAQDIELKPNTDYVYQAWIYGNMSTIQTAQTKPLLFWVWEGDTAQSTRLCTIVDYSQNLTVGRYNLCYIHFKTNDVQKALHGRFFFYTQGTSTDNPTLAFRQVGLYEGTIPIKWTPSSNEIVTGITTIDHQGIKVEHSNVDTTTRMSADGFSIQDNNGDVLAWLSSKEQWTELKVDKVFANNIENVYEGESNLYVDHSATVAGDGTSSKPFNSFAQLSNHLMANPVINKDIYVVVRDPGFIINEQLYLERLKGTGFIKITLEGNLVIANAGNGQYCIRLHQISKWVWIVSGREFGSKTTGAVLQDGGNGNGHGIYATDVDRLEVDALTIACSNWGILTERTHLYTWHMDFGKCYCAIELRYMSIYYSSDDVGSCTDFCRLQSGSFAYWGCGTVRPQGNVQKSNGMYYDGGVSLTPTASPRYPSANPTPPSTSGQYFTKTYNCTSKQSYQYAWSNWSSDGSCKQGQWNSSYGLRGGHLFFDMTTIRAEITGTIQDGNTITLTRANSGGMSGDANVYINGSSCSSASGTPSYSNQTHLGTLKWGETKTFTLPKEIVQNLINGTCNSLAVYVNSTANNNYINITSASITLKTKK